MGRHNTSQHLPRHYYQYNTGHTTAWLLLGDVATYMGHNGVTNIRFHNTLNTKGNMHIPNIVSTPLLLRSLLPPTSRHNSHHCHAIDHAETIRHDVCKGSAQHVSDKAEHQCHANTMNVTAATLTAIAATGTEPYR